MLSTTEAQLPDSAVMEVLEYSQSYELQQNVMLVDQDIHLDRTGPTPWSIGYEQGRANTNALPLLTVNISGNCTT
jgi:hypothetical protein